MKNFFFGKILMILMTIILIGCGNKTMYDVFKNENIPLELNGKIIDIDYYKGGNTILTVRNKTGKNSGAFDKRFYELVQLWDSIKKKPYSNKCLITRKDSIFFLDCYEFDENLKDSFPNLSKWNEKIKGKWISKNNAEIKNLIE
ncbi:hypothetical protein V8G61_11120 [Gaetbulibacter sp. M240]|uniref:hypothetical protein n=1 Tax=Gaetbulibacter sp. M240 TaxID=3126511 RepID=UPI00374F2434